MEFKAPKDQENFIHFKIGQFGKRFFTVPFSLFVSLLFVAYWVLAMIRYPRPLAIFTSVFTVLFSLPLLWFLTYTKQCEVSLSPRTSCCAENLFMLCGSVSVGCIVLLRIGQGLCSAQTFWDFWDCPPLSVGFITIFIPLLCSHTLPFTSAVSLGLGYLWSMFVIAYAASDGGTVGIIPWIVVCYVMVMLLQGITSWSHIQLYLYFLKVEEMQRQKNEDAARQGEEMRNLIGKIAHDLRTPLVAFRYGLDVMQGSMQQLSAAGSDAEPRLWSYVQTWAAALEGLQQAHLHLMMIIDRCMDYHKLCHGLPLIPKYAPTSLSLVLEAVMNHAHRSLDSAQVKVERTDVLGYIMTDPGWLQDNLLCLISNAIRFSSPRSPVIIRVIHSGGVPIHAHGSSNSSNSSGLLGPPLSVVDSVGDLEEGGHASTASAAVLPPPAPAVMVRIEVEDFGVGLSEDKLPSLFIPPESSAERSVGGAGLGLYCLAERIKSLQGEYGVQRKGIDDNAARNSGRLQSQPLLDDGKHGSVFWFTLPLTSINMANPTNGVLLRRCSDSVHLSLSTSMHSLISIDLDIDVIPNEDDSSNSSLRPKGSKESIGSLLGSKVSFSSQGSETLRLSPTFAGQRANRGFPRPPIPPIPTPSPSTRAKANDNSATAAQIFKDMHLRVLIVDDSPLILKMLKMMFLGKGHAVVTTTNGYEALSMLKQAFDRATGAELPSAALDALNSASVSTVDLEAGLSEPPVLPTKTELDLCYDVLLVDIQMPIIDGLEMMREYHKMLKDYHALDACTSLPLIVAMSANTDHVTMQDSYTAGADHFLQKPFDIDTFYAVLLKHRRHQKKAGLCSESQSSSAKESK